MIADYDKVGPFVNDSPPAVDADAFNQFEAGIDAVTEEAQRLAGPTADGSNTAVAWRTPHKVGHLTSGAFTYVGNDAAFTAGNNYIKGYLSSGIYFDGTNWQCLGGAGTNAWTVIAFHADGTAVMYGDTSSGDTNRSYTEAQFIALRVGAIPATPATFFEDGTIDGQTIVWNQSGGMWEVGTIDIPTLTAIRDSKTTTTSLGPSATGTIDGLNGEFALPANALAAVGDTLVLTVIGTYHNQSGSPRTFTFTPKLQGLDLNLAQALSMPNSASIRGWKAVVEVMRTGADTLRSSMVIFNSISTPNIPTYGAQSGFNPAATAAILFNLNQTLSDADLEQAVTAARYEVV